MCFPSKREMEGELSPPLCCRVEQKLSTLCRCPELMPVGEWFSFTAEWVWRFSSVLPPADTRDGKVECWWAPTHTILFRLVDAIWGCRFSFSLVPVDTGHVSCVVCRVCVWGGWWSVVVANPVSHSFVKSVCCWVVEVAQLALDTVGTTLNGWIWAPLASTGCRVWKTSFLCSLATNPAGFFESTSTSSWTWKISFLPSFIYTVLVGKELQHPCEWNRRSVACFVLLMIVGLTACPPYSGWEEGAYGRFSCGLGPTETGRVHVHVCVCGSFVEGLWLEYGGYYWKGFCW